MKLTPSLVLFVAVLLGAYAGFLTELSAVFWVGWVLLSSILACVVKIRVVKALLILAIGFCVASCLAQLKHEEYKIRGLRIPSTYGPIDGVVEESVESFLRGKKVQLRSDLGFRVLLSLQAGAAMTHLEPGDRIRIWGQVKHLQHAMAPGEFDSYWFGLARHFDGRIKISSPFKIKIINKHLESDFFTKQRESFRNRISQLGTPRQASVLLALAIGDTALFDSEQKEIYTQVGAGHLLAVSGLQVSCLSFLFFYFFRMILLLMPKLGRLSRATIPAVILTLCAIWTFVIFSGNSASAVRSAMMSSVILLGVLMKRSAAMIDGFGLAGFLTVLIWPESVFDPSFTLSYLAIFGILVGGSLGAGVITMPLSAYYFGMLAVGGVLANWILVPVAVFLQTPAIALGVLGFVDLAASLAGMIEALCEALGDYLGGYWYLEPPSGFQVAGATIALALLVGAKAKAKI